MNQTDTLDWQEGWLCVRYVDTEWSNPIKVIQWWQVTKMPEAFAKANFPIGEKLRYCSNGLYDWKCPRTWQVLRFPLKDGGKTVAFKRVEEPIPCPKSRGKEMRYYNGGWQKLLKQGWIPA